MQFLTTWIKDLGVINRNIIEIKSTERTPISPAYSAGKPLKDKETIHYDPSEPKAMHANIRHDNKYKILPFGAVTRIRELGLNIKKRKHWHRVNWINHHHGPDTGNLLKIKRINQGSSGNIIMGQCNIQSLKAKHLEVSELVYFKIIL